MKLILDSFRGIQSNARLAEDNLKSAYEAQIATLESEKLNALSKAREALKSNVELKEKLQATEGIIDTVKTLNEELRKKNKEIDKFIYQVCTHKALEEKASKYALHVAKLETENSLLKERIDEYRSLLKFNFQDDQAIAEG